MGNISNGADMNNVHDYGYYFMSRAYTFSHCPISGEWGTLEVFGGNTGDTLSKIQRITAASGVYYRTFSSNTWTGWNKLTMTSA